VETRTAVEIVDVISGVKRQVAGDIWRLGSDPRNGSVGSMGKSSRNSTTVFSGNFHSGISCRARSQSAIRAWGLGGWTRNHRDILRNWGISLLVNQNLSKPYSACDHDKATNCYPYPSKISAWSGRIRPNLLSMRGKVIPDSLEKF
jgi:hypothetical protein